MVRVLGGHAVPHDAGLDGVRHDDLEGTGVPPWGNAQDNNLGPGSHFHVGIHASLHEPDGCTANYDDGTSVNTSQWEGRKCHSAVGGTVEKRRFVPVHMDHSSVPWCMTFHHA